MAKYVSRMEKLKSVSKAAENTVFEYREKRVKISPVRDQFSKDDRKLDITQMIQM